MDTTGSVGISWPGAIPAEMEAYGTDDGLGSDVDRGARCRGHPGGRAGTRPRPSARSAAPGRRPARSPRARRRPPRSRGPDETGPGAAVRGGNGPSSRRNGRWSRRHGHATGLHRGHEGRVGYTLSRAAPPTGRRLRLRAPPPGRRPIDRRQFLQLSALGAAGFATTSRLSATHSTQRVPARARRHAQQDLPAVVDTKLAERRHRADGAVADRRERQAGHVELDLQPRPARPRARGLRQPGRARCPATTSPLFVNTTARAVQVQAYRMGYYQGLGGRLVVQTDFVAGQAPARSGRHARHSAR